MRVCSIAMLVRALALVSSLLFVLCSASAYGQAAPTAADKSTARQLAIEGNKALGEKDYATAADRYSRAEQLYHAPTLLIGLARSYNGLGKFVEAYEAYNRVLREPLGSDASKAFRKAQEEAKAEIGPVEKKIAHATITVLGAENPTVLLDGEPLDSAGLGVKRPVNPGEHEVKASERGYLAQSKSFSIESGELTEITLELPPAPDSGLPSGGMKPIRIGGFAALGLGAAGLAVGGVTGGLALGQHGDLTDGCPGNVCPPDQSENLDSFRTMGSVSTAGFVAGGVLAAVGVTLVILGASDDEPAAASFDARGLRFRF